ncbi:MAG TPA: hypothetical protein VNC82_15205 [Candidatus Limnocylindria bacterium]|nr:hypothetical protein [Candidatus Limnocylindria bacterium]
MPTLRVSDADAIAYDDTGQGPVIVLVVKAIASHAPRGIIETLEHADHAMTTTHAVATLIAKLADGGA